MKPRAPEPEEAAPPGAAPAEPPRSRSRARLLLAALAVLALWPAIQLALVRTWDVNPWKLFGWAMYTQAPPGLDTRVGLEGDDGTVWLPRHGLAPAPRAALDAYRERRRALGRLASTDALGEAVHARYPEAKRVVVECRFVELKEGWWRERVEEDVAWP